MSGYTECKCHNCFEIAISDTDEPDFCLECKEAECSKYKDTDECQVVNNEQEQS